eukprot:TRINITY_DN250_c0_g2_i1.p1 TRINITY_DN250_c0_g2~~TRINITY_DN250_c0_g2_i1.p1  ORF type:complete len:91 (+),score=13.15 TRINITY_DN250_c0_g2_i1:34-273(+)
MYGIDKQMNGFELGGLFRVPGNQREMDRVQEMFNKGNYDILSSSAEFLPTNAHVPASVMKLWFRKLKDSIIPQSYYFDC